MRQLVLHVGPQDTTAGAIEAGLCLNREALGAAGWLVPAAGLVPPAGGHALLALQLTCLAPAPEDLFAVLRDEVERSGSQQAIVSCEELWGVPARLIRALRALLPSTGVTIVAMLGPQEAWLQARWPKLSGYRWASGEERGEFAAWAAKVLNPRGRGFTRIRSAASYGTVLEKWAAAFGKENVKVGVLEQVSGLEPFHQFLSLCGVPDVTRFDAPPASDLPPGPRVLAALRHIMPEVDRLYPESSGRRRLVADAVARLIVRHGVEQDWGRDPSPLADAALCERIAAHFGAENRALAQRYLGRNELFALPRRETASDVSTPASMSGTEALALVASMLIGIATCVEAQPRAVAPWLFGERGGARRAGFWLRAQAARFRCALDVLRDR